MAIIEHHAPKFRIGDLHLRVQPIRVKTVGRKLDDCIEAERRRVGMERSPDRTQVQFTEPVLARFAPPHISHCARLRDQIELVHQQERTAVDPDIPRVLKHRQQLPNERRAVGRGIVLSDQDVLVEPIPAPRPVFVGPAHTEWKVWRAAGQHFVEGLLQQSLAVEPVGVITEPVDAELARQVRLPCANLGRAQVVIAEFGGLVRLLVAHEVRQRFAHIGPLGKPRAPPPVVLRDWVILGQIESNDTNVAGYRRGVDLAMHRPHLLDLAAELLLGTTPLLRRPD